MVAADSVDEFHVEWGGSRAFFGVAVEAEAIGVDVWPEYVLDIACVAMVVEYYGLFIGKYFIKLLLGEFVFFAR